MCCYEDFLADRDVAFERVFDALGLEPSSSTARTKRLVVDKPINDLNKPRPWYAPLKEAEGEEVLRLCREFGLGLYGKQSMPLYSPREFLDDASIAVAQKALDGRFEYRELDGHRRWKFASEPCRHRTGTRRVSNLQ